MKKFMKALALALALCMVLSVSAFAVDKDAYSVSTANRTVDFKVTGLTAGEQVALLVLRDGAELTTAGENDILYIDQKAVATGATEVAFTATIATGANNDVVDVYVGSQSISDDANAGAGKAWAIYPNVAVAETSSITLSETDAIFLNVTEGEITRPGAAIGVNVKKKALDKMIWVLTVNDSDNPYRFSKAVDINVAASLEGEVWFTGVFSSTALEGLTISNVAAIFRDANGSEEYYMGTTKSEMEEYKNN